MRNNKPKYCKHCKGKYCYSSEAKALRAVNKYEEIQRAYYCEPSDSWHTTSISINRSLKIGLIEEEQKPKPSKIKRQLKRRLEYLTKKNKK